MTAEVHPPRLRAAGITVSYGERRLLAGVDLELCGGQLVAVTGPSGSGKTTLLMVLAGVLKPDAGMIEVSGGTPRGAVPVAAAASGEKTVPEPEPEPSSRASHRSDPLLVPDIPAPRQDSSGSGAAVRDAIAEHKNRGGRPAGGRRRRSAHASGIPARRDTRVGYVPQTLGLAPWLTAVENVAIVLQLLDLPPDVVRRRAERVLSDVGLETAADRLVTELSGGQRQRVAVARGLAAEPDMLIADEPTAELDAENRQMVLGLMIDAAAGGALAIVATHDPDVSEACAVVYELREGRLVEA